MKTAEEALEPRIYVACLAAYNHGRLHGAWIDVVDEDQVMAEIAAMLAASPMAGAEEFAIHDAEGFHGADIAEHAAIASVVELADFVKEHGALGVAVLAELRALEEARQALEDRYQGVFLSLADWIQDLTEETTPVPEALRHYIDWEAMGRDARLNGDVFTIETAHDQVHVFWAR